MTLFLLSGGCGGSSHSASGSRSPTGTGTSAATQARTATQPTRTQRPGTVNPQGGLAGASNARVPASFMIRAGGKLSPVIVSIPAFIAVQVSASSVDGHAHTVLVHARTTLSLHVPAGGHVSSLIAGLRAGRYPVFVDGAQRGSLLVGGEPGP